MRKFITLFLLLPTLAFAYELSKDPLKITDDTSFPSAINPKALLELESTTKGLMWPRMTTDQKDAITDAFAGDTVLEEAYKGTFVFDIDRNKPYVWDGARWKIAGGGGAGGGFQYLAIAEINADDVKLLPTTFLTGKDAAFPTTTTGVASVEPELVKDPLLTYDPIENLLVFRWAVGVGLDETDDFVLGPAGIYPPAYLQSTHDSRLRLWYWTNINPGLINFYLWCDGATQPLPVDGLANIDTDVNANDLRDKEGAIFSADWSAIPADCNNFRLGFKATGNIPDGGYVLWDQYRLGILLDPFEEDLTKGPETNHWDFVFKYYNGNGDDSTAIQLESGNNLTFGGAGVLDGVFDFDTTGKVGPMRGRSFSFASGTGTTINNWIKLRDSFYIPNYTGNILNEIELRINFWYWRNPVLTTSSIEPRLECYDSLGISTGAYAATSPLGPLPSTDTNLDGLVDTNEGNFIDAYFTVPSDGTCYQAKFGFQQVAEEDSVKFLFDRVRPGLLKAPDSINVQNNDFEVMFYFPEGRANTPSLLTNGQDVTFGNGGVLDGTFARTYVTTEVVIPNAANSNAAFKYTSGTGVTLNNWVALVTATIPQGYKDDGGSGRDVLVSYWYWTDLTNNSAEPRLFCDGLGTPINPSNTGNRGILNTDYNNDNIKDADEGNRTQVSFYVPKACGTVRFGFQQTVEEDSRVLLFDDVRIGIMPRHYVDVVDTSAFSIGYTVTTAYQANSFSAKISAAGVVTDESSDWINGNCVVASPTTTCTFNVAHFTTVPNCTTTSIDGVTNSFNEITAQGTGTVAWKGRDESISADTVVDSVLICHRQGADFKDNTSLTTDVTIDNITNRKKIIIPTWNEIGSIGEIVAFAHNAIPADFLTADGSSILVADYPSLFAKIGCVYGCLPDEITPVSFAIPDYRGTFLRGHDAGRGLDPNAAARTGGDNVGSTQGYTNSSHRHTYTSPGGASSADGGGGVSISHSGFGSNTGFSGGNETRPVNTYVVYAIRHAITDYTQMVAYPVVQYEFENTYVGDIAADGTIVSQGAPFLASCTNAILCTFSETFLVQPVCTANGAPATTTLTTVAFTAAITNLICHRQGLDYRSVGSQISILNAASLTPLDEDDMISNSATEAASQQSVKAYVDATVAGVITAGAWIGNADQILTQDTTVTILHQVEEVALVDLTESGTFDYFTANTDGTYSLFVQPQIKTGAGGSGEIHVWFETSVDVGVPITWTAVANSSAYVEVPANSGALIPLHINLPLLVGNHFRIRAYSNSTDSILNHIVAGQIDDGTPVVGIPATPSTLLTVTRH